MKPRSFAAMLILFFAATSGNSWPADLGYDPAANPATSLAMAQQEAARSGKRVLVIAGGDWCRWCHVLDAFLSRNTDIRSALDEAFVVIKVYYGDENFNEAFFADLPSAEAYPHFWIVEKDGTSVSIETAGLERGNNDYDKALFLQMIRDASKL